jgi:hypothetical protein
MKNVFSIGLIVWLSVPVFAVAELPLTEKERANAAEKAALQMINEVNQHLQPNYRFRPKVLSVTEGKPEVPGAVIVRLRGGDPGRTDIYCECRVRTAMHVDLIQFGQGAKAVEDHPSRADRVESIERILLAWAATQNEQCQAAVKQKFAENKTAVRKVGGFWEVFSGPVQVFGVPGLKQVGFCVVTNPKYHRLSSRFRM